MAEKEFFAGWIGRVVRCEDSTWKLIEKLGEKNDQLSAEEYNVRDESNPGYGLPSAAYGAFRCQNLHNPNDMGFMKIILQIPWAGSEFTSPEERAKQATISILPYHAKNEIGSLKTLTNNKCKATPLIRKHLEVEQKADGLVPGGFLHFILLDYAPGLKLSESIFWSLEREERDRIRDAFRVAYEECLRAGVIPFPCQLSHLFWDSMASKIIIVGFRHSSPATPKKRWMDNCWIYWDLARGPKGFRPLLETDPHPEKSNWVL